MFSGALHRASFCFTQGSDLKIGLSAFICRALLWDVLWRDLRTIGYYPSPSEQKPHKLKYSDRTMKFLRWSKISSYGQSAFICSAVVKCTLRRFEDDLFLLLLSSSLLNLEDLTISISLGFSEMYSGKIWGQLDLITENCKKVTPQAKLLKYIKTNTITSIGFISTNELHTCHFRTSEYVYEHKCSTHLTSAERNCHKNYSHFREKKLNMSTNVEHN